MAPTLATFLLLLAAPAGAATPKQEAVEDPVMRALADEIARYQALKSGAIEAPYYLSGSVNDIESFTAAASFGALVTSHREGRRSAAVEVRVGTPNLDNTNFNDGQPDFSFLMTRLGPPVPWEADYDALRQSLWLRFDSELKHAVEALARKKAFLETNEVTDRPPDFGSPKVTEIVLPRIALSVDEPRWIRIGRNASAVFRPGAGFATGTATFRAEVGNQCFTSTAPVRDRFGDSRASFALAASTQARDGMELELTWEAVGHTESDLPADAALVQAAQTLSNRLTALAQAPVLPEDYSGPVLFTGRAAARFFLRALGEPLSHPREPLGQSQEGRLVELLKKRVAASILTARDDPTQRSWRGTPLIGWYPIDDDGVLPEPITLVEKGVLKTYYMSEVPTRQISASNGHSRAGQGSVANLFIETSKPESRAALKRKLIDLAKQNGQEYGLWVEDFREPSNQERGAMLFEGLGGGGSAGGDIRLPPPAYLYRVYLDGREELVRGATFKPLSFQALKDIVAMGNDRTVLSTTSLGQAVSVVAPAVLVKQVELKRPTRQFERPPEIPRPVVKLAP